MATRVVVTSLVRYAGLQEPSGFLRVVDLEQARVLASYAVPESAERPRDPNPRGGRRGAKGIGIHQERLVVGNADRLFVLDRTWKLSGEITHPWTAGIHDVLCEAGGIWVTGTDCDLLTHVGWDGRMLASWSWRSDACLVQELGFQSVPAFDADRDHRDPLTAHTGVHNMVHLNGIARGEDGLLVSFGRIRPAETLTGDRARAAAASLLDRLGAGRAAVSAVRKRRSERILSQAGWPVEPCAASAGAIVLLRDDKAALGPPRARVLLRTPTPAGVPNHNVLQIGNRVLYNDSNQGRLVAHQIGVATGDDHAIAIPGAPPFPRGLAALDASRFLVGSQRPAAIHVVDLERRAVTRSIPLGGLENESVYAVATLPASFEDPRERLFR